jgi:hypothetical protein
VVLPLGVAKSHPRCPQLPVRTSARVKEAKTAAKAPTKRVIEKAPAKQDANKGRAPPTKRTTVIPSRPPRVVIKRQISVCFHGV